MDGKLETLKSEKIWQKKPHMIIQTERSTKGWVHTATECLQGGNDQRKRSIFTYTFYPNGPKDIFKMSNNCLDSKTSCVDVFRMSKPQLSCKSKQRLTKALIWDLRNTSQRYLRSASKTLLRQFTKPFLRYLKGSCFENLTSAWENHCLGNLYTYLEIVLEAFQGV